MSGFGWRMVIQRISTKRERWMNENPIESVWKEREFIFDLYKLGFLSVKISRKIKACRHVPTRSLNR